MLILLVTTKEGRQFQQTISKDTKLSQMEYFERIGSTAEIIGFLP